ncbi:DUF5655 domain-containing protein [Alteromonas flava]|uniref:DUF5655 domain-containing protein n=1 Tax=Alteromonas flava TaxID=2048003 RepID=UPI000C2954A9|nr:DUF5655 domain-containing protein [Alteromonas flava]
MEENLLEKTGKTLAQWKTTLAPKNFSKHGEIMAFLKGECGISHGYANFIAHKFRESDAASKDPEELVNSQYKGKENLKPIYTALITQIQTIGSDVEIVPKNKSVSCKRKRQFALIQPSTKTRIDLGLKFNDRACEGRLESSGPFGTMCSHRVQITELAQVDDDLLQLIIAAYAEAS